MTINLKKIKRCSKLQLDHTDCGVACIVSLVEFYGGTATFDYVRQLSGTSLNGTSLLGLYEAARELGFDTKGYVADISDIIEYGCPLILHTQNQNGFEHFIIFYGCSKGQFIIWDPSKGLDILSRDTLNKYWRSKKCLTLTPGEKFKTKKKVRRLKTVWLKNLLSRDYPVLISATVLGIVISVLGLTMAVFSQKLIDEILVQQHYNSLLVLTIIAFLLLSFRVVLSSVRQYILILQGNNFNISMIDNFYARLLYLNKSFFESRSTGDLVARLNDTVRIQKFITDIAGSYIIDLLVCVVSLIALFIYSFMTGMVGLIFIPVLLIIALRKNKQILISQKKVLESYALSESNYIDTLQGITEIKAFNQQKVFAKRNFAIYSQMLDNILHLGKLRVKINSWIGIVSSLFLFVVVMYNSLLVIHGELTTGQLMAILTITSTMLTSVINLAMVIFSFNESKVAFSRMFDYTFIDGEDVVDIKENMPKEIKEIELKEISFRYKGHKELLRNINIKLEVGKIVSLIGESGSGKSTIGKLILRYYCPDQGYIRINKREAEDICVEKWRERVLYIPQEVHIFNGTLLENLCLYDHSGDVNKLIEYLNDNYLYSFFEKFPNGLNTIVGENGITLSGGEKQYIAFCRALSRNPDFLIIDEGISAIDRTTEYFLLDLLKRIKETTGILLITHRIDAIQSISDYIYILEDGFISDNGTHEKLLKGNNYYRKLWYDP